MKIVEKPGFTVVGLEVAASFEDLAQDVPAAFKELYSRYAEIPHRIGSTFVEVTVEVRDGRHRVLVGAMVDPGTAALGLVPAGMTAAAFPAARYVHHQHEGPLPEIAGTYDQMYDWATAHGLRLGDFKVDQGHTPDNGEPHELHVRIVD